MTLQKPTRDFLAYLRDHPGLRNQIRSPRDRTLLYAGGFFPRADGSLKPMWKEIVAFKRKNPELADKEILPDVLERLPAPGTPFANLKLYVEDVDRRVRDEDAFILWRALSGIYAANAMGSVSFQIGSGIEPSEKVFAATELGVLLRNPDVDATTRNLLAYFQRCVRNRQSDINVGFWSASG